MGPPRPEEASWGGGSEWELNKVKFVLTVARARRNCLEEAADMLYHAWGRGKSYATVRLFCVEALGWQPDQLAVTLNQQCQFRDLIHQLDRPFVTPNCTPMPARAVQRRSLLNPSLVAERNYNVAATARNTVSHQQDVGSSAQHSENVSSERRMLNTAFSLPSVICTVSESHTVEARQELESHYGPSLLKEFEGEPDFRRLSWRALVVLITKVVPQLPPRVTELLVRIMRFPYTLCYMDLEFNNNLLAFKIKDLNSLVAELLKLVSCSCKKVITNNLKEISDKHKVAKQKLGDAQRDFRDHLSYVLQTRREVKVAEKDMKEDHTKNFQINKVYSHSHSQNSSEDESCKDVRCASRNQKKKQLPSTMGKDSRGASGEADTKDEVSSVTEQEDAEDDIFQSNDDSLLMSVMREVAVIERRHSSLISVDRKMKMVLRKTHQSVLLTKREVRDRLDSTVSAEEGAITKEVVLAQRQTQAKKLFKQIKKLRKDLADIHENENNIVEGISNDVKGLIATDLDEEVLEKGRKQVKEIYEDQLGRTLLESRREAVSFAARVRMMDLGEWLGRGRYVMTCVERLYSRVVTSKSTDTVDIIDLLGPEEQFPSVVVLSGPKGGGKSCVCHFLLHQWKSYQYQESRQLLEFDLVVYCTMGNVLSSGSWEQYLREHVFCNTMRDLPDCSIHQVLEDLTILFILDINIITPAVHTVLDAVFPHLGKNHKALVTVRSGGEREVSAAAKEHNRQSVTAWLCPLTPETLLQYATNFISLYKLDKASSADSAEKFTKCLSSMKVAKDVLYPVPVAYLLYLWQVKPTCLPLATTVSRIFSQVLMVVEEKLEKALEGSTVGSSSSVRTRAEQYLHQLTEASWAVVNSAGWPHNHPVLLEPRHSLLQDSTLSSPFTPLLMIKDGPDLQLNGYLPHTAIAEVLSGFFLARQRLLTPKKSPLVRSQNRQVKNTVEARRMRCVLPHVAAALVYRKHSAEVAREIVALYEGCVDEHNMEAWLALLEECGFLSSVCKATSRVLSARYSTWAVAAHPHSTNCAVADLLRNAAYQPGLVVISQGSSLDCGVNCIIHALSICSSTLVHLRNEIQFYAWGKPATCDALVAPLQPPGTLSECWGHLGVEGALALRHSHHLGELNVRISSCEALEALSLSMEHLRRSLCYLYLRLDLPPQTPISSLHPLNFKGKKLWLRLHRVGDGSVGWVLEVASRLNTWYSELVLEQSSLSPAAFQHLKDSLPNTAVHISS